MDTSQNVEENGGDKGESYWQKFFLKMEFAGNSKKNPMPKSSFCSPKR